MFYHKLSLHPRKQTPSGFVEERHFKYLSLVEGCCQPIVERPYLKRLFQGESDLPFSNINTSLAFTIFLKNFAEAACESHWVVIFLGLLHLYQV